MVNAIHGFDNASLRACIILKIFSVGIGSTFFLKNHLCADEYIKQSL